MAIRRRCKYCNGNNGKRCFEHLQLDVKFRGIRFRMPVNDFAIPRMGAGQQRPVQSIEEARDWERLFIGEIKAGRDPRRTPSRAPHVGTSLDKVSGFLDAYLERCIKPAGLRSVRSIRSRITVLKEHRRVPRSWRTAPSLRTTRRLRVLGRSSALPRRSPACPRSARRACASRVDSQTIGFVRVPAGDVSLDAVTVLAKDTPLRSGSEAISSQQE